MDIFGQIMLNILLVIIFLVICFFMPSYSFFWGVIKLVSLFTMFYVIMDINNSM